MEEGRGRVGAEVMAVAGREALSARRGSPSGMVCVGGRSCAMCVAQKHISARQHPSVHASAYECKCAD